VKMNCYAETAQIHKIRKQMVEIMTKKAGTVQLLELVKELILESIRKEIEKQAQGIFRLKGVFIRRVKIIKKQGYDLVKFMEACGDGDVYVETVGYTEDEKNKPEELKAKFDITKLTELHGDASVEMPRPENEDAVNTLTADVRTVRRLRPKPWISLTRPRPAGVELRSRRT